MLPNRMILSALPALALLGCSGDSGPVSTATAQNQANSADAVLADVVEALGVADVDAVTLEGSAWQIRNGFMQTPNASPPWPYRDYIMNYRHTTDLSEPALLAQGDTYASNLFLNPPAPGTYTQHVAADDTGWSDRLQIYLTPWGFVDGAEEHGVELGTETMDGTEYDVLSWTTGDDQTSPSGMPYTVNAYIGDDDLIRRVETWVEDPFMGDFHIVNTYDAYEDFDGLMVPTEIEQHRGGGAVFGIHRVTDARANPDDLAELMTPPESGGGGFGGGGGGQPPSPSEIVEEVGDGVWLITGGYVALVAEFSDHLLVFEGGQSEARGEQIIAAIESELPDKPIRYIVNSHPHSDHTAGLVPFIREGATLVAHEGATEFLEMALSTPRTLAGEEPLNPTVEGVEGVGVYEDDTMRVELHSVPNFHTEDMLVAVLPEHGILFQADFTLPQQGAEANPFVKTLARYVVDNDVQFDRYLAVHAANEPQTRDDLVATIEDEQ